MIDGGEFLCTAKGTEGVALSGKKGLYQDGSLERPMLAPKGQYGEFDTVNLSGKRTEYKFITI